MPGSGERLAGLSARAAFLSLSFITLALAASFIGLGVAAVVINLVPILRSEGIASSAAAEIAGLVGVGAILGRLCGGILLDRVDARLVAAATVATPVVPSLM